MTPEKTPPPKQSYRGTLARLIRLHAHGRAAGSLAGALILAGAAGCGDSSTAAAPASSPKPAQEAPHGGQSETLDLGETKLRQTRLLEDSTINVRFNAHAVASEENAQRLGRILAARHHQARQEVIVAVRTAETWEFDETELTRLRRRIQFRLNRWLDAPLVEDVVVTDFRFRVD